MLDEEQPSKRQQQGWRSRVENHKKLPIHLNWLSFASWTPLVYQCFYDISIGYQGKRSPIPYTHPLYPIPIPYTLYPSSNFSMSILTILEVKRVARWGFTAAPLEIDSLAIGDSLPRYWGFTSSPLGIHSLAIGEILES